MAHNVIHGKFCANSKFLDTLGYCFQNLDSLDAFLPANIDACQLCHTAAMSNCLPEQRLCKKKLLPQPLSVLGLCRQWQPKRRGCCAHLHQSSRTWRLEKALAMCDLCDLLYPNRDFL